MNIDIADSAKSVPNTSAHYRIGQKSNKQVQSNGSTTETHLEQGDGK